MNVLYKRLLFLHAFIGVGALFGGGIAIYDPTGELIGMSPEILENGPFESFLIPGLFLFLVNGCLNIVAAYTAHRRYRFQGYISGVMGIIMMMWIAIQCYVLADIVFLHVMFFVLGCIQAVLALALCMRTNLFPFQYKK